MAPGQVVFGDRLLPGIQCLRAAIVVLGGKLCVRQLLPDRGVIRRNRNDAPAQLDDGHLVARLFRLRELFLQLRDVASRTLQRLKLITLEIKQRSEAWGKLKQASSAIYRYEDMVTPYDKLKSLPEAHTYLKPHASFSALKALALSITDNEAVEQLNKARTTRPC